MFLFLNSFVNWFMEPSSLITTIIAILTLIIATQQYKTNRYKLRLDLYEKRYNIYQKVKTYLDNIRINPDQEIHHIREFKYSISESNFLFENDITDFILKIVNTSFALEEQMNTLECNCCSEDERKGALHRKNELLIELNNDFKNVTNIFMKYLSFRRIK